MEQQRLRGQESDSVCSAFWSMRVGAIVSHGQDRLELQTELDSHADTCVVGNETALVTHDFERPVRVFAYDGSPSALKTYKVVTAVIGYAEPSTGDAYMLVLHQAILVPCLKMNLLGIMQLQDNDVLVNDEPKHMALNPTEEHHSIFVPGNSKQEPLRIQFLIIGVTSYFPSWKPTKEEY